MRHLDMTDDEHITAVVRDGVRQGIADVFGFDLNDPSEVRAVRAGFAEMIQRQAASELRAVAMPAEAAKMVLGVIGAAIVAFVTWAATWWSTKPPGGHS